MVHDRSATHDTRLAPRERSKTRTARSARRGRAVQERVGRSPRKRSTRPASRDPRRKAARAGAGGLRRTSRPQRGSTKGRQPSNRAGSGQGARKN